MAATNSESKDPIVSELESVKRLLILRLIRDGASQEEIAGALGVTQPTVSRMFPKGFCAAARSSRLTASKGAPKQG